MAYDDNSNPREELYNRFRDSLTRSPSERFFDEDELVEVYDYAGDLSDSYVQMEVLFCGARLYPESPALAERRALMYFDATADDSGQSVPLEAYLADNPEAASPLFDMMRMETTRPADGAEALEFLMSQYEKFSDEEIIRLVILAADLDCYDWLLANLPRLRKKVSYLPSLLYEVMQEADDRADDETVIALAEELIELEPFAVVYWVMLFRAQARAGKEEEARSTFDYARALSADNMNGLMNLAEIVYNYAPYLRSEALDLLQSLKADYPDEFMVTDCRCAILVQAGRSSDALAEVGEFVKKHPAESRALRQLLLCNVREASQYVEDFYTATGGKGFEPEELDDLINNLHLRSAMASLDGLLRVVEAHGQLTPIGVFSWLEALFALGKYERVAEIIGSSTEVENLVQVPLRGPAAAYIYVVALMKLNRPDEAAAFMETVRPIFEAILEDAPMPVRMAVRCYMTLADKVRRHPASERLYWERFDMLTYGKSVWGDTAKL